MKKKKEKSNLGDCYKVKKLKILFLITLYYFTLLVEILNNYNLSNLNKKNYSSSIIK